MRFLTLHQKIDEIYHLYFLDLITKFQNNLLQYSKQLIPPIILLPDLRSRVFFISKLQQDCVSFFRSLVTPVICNIWFIIFFIDTGNSTWSIRSQNNTCKIIQLLWFVSLLSLHCHSSSFIEILCSDWFGSWCCYACSSKRHSSRHPKFPTMGICCLSH